MPRISRWFDAPKELPWEESTESPWEALTGARFYTYPLTWLVPYVEISHGEMSEAPKPLWITDIAPTSPIGVVCEQQEGTFIIDLPDSFEAYLAMLSGKTRKRFRATLKKNSDLELRHDSYSDIDLLWPYFVERLQLLAVRAGGEKYTESELNLRREFYGGAKIKTTSFLAAGEVIAVNISFWEEQTVYDLACLIKPLDWVLDRSVGTLAVLQNIMLAIEAGMTSYDMLSLDYGYKRSFGAKEHKLKTVIVCSPLFAQQYRIPEGLWISQTSIVPNTTDE